MATSDPHLSIKAEQREQIPWVVRRAEERANQKAQRSQFQMWVKKQNPPATNQPQQIPRYGNSRR